MSYFRDGSKYTYTPGENAINIGWLDAKEHFPTGSVPDGFLSRLRSICRHSVKRTRGLYRCSLCPRIVTPGMQPPIRIESAEGEYVVGGAEIRVHGQGGFVYASPDMIVHYVEAHRYRPPDEFIASVLSAPQPSD